jgi:hypothetical protein
MGVTRVGYTPIFSNVFSGTLCGKYPDTAVWMFMLALADRSGEVDKTAEYIAFVTGMPIELLKQGIEALSQPDPHSRTKTRDGRRIELIDPQRPWGWRIINHGKYREKARLYNKNANAIESGANRQRMSDRRRPPETAADRPSDTDTDTDPSSPHSSSKSSEEARAHARTRAHAREEVFQFSKNQKGKDPPRPVPRNGDQAHSDELAAKALGFESLADYCRAGANGAKHEN